MHLEVRNGRWVVHSEGMSHTLSNKTSWPYLRTRGFDLNDLMNLLYMAQDGQDGITPDAAAIYRSLTDHLNGVRKPKKVPSGRPRMTFGKYKNREPRYVPRDYLEWAVENVKWDQMHDGKRLKAACIDCLSYEGSVQQYLDSITPAPQYIPDYLA